MEVDDMRAFRVWLGAALLAGLSCASGKQEREPANNDGAVAPPEELVFPDGQSSVFNTTGPCEDRVCVEPPGPCSEGTGACDSATGACVYDPLPAGTACVLNDACVTQTSCDGQGSCVGTPVTCTAPHAAGTCLGGGCQSYQCDPGWGNCNGDWTDGCEVDLDKEVKHCGACNTACAGGPHAKAVCTGGACGLSCSPPYEDCNNDPADGCEIPVGQPNSCSRTGLTAFSPAAGATPGCGTPHCGPGGTAAQSFGSWHCSFCDHCQLFDDGGAWCLETSGTFSPDRCTACCNPSSPQFPQVCPN